MFDGLYIMSEQTWQSLKDMEFDFANTQPDPIRYIMLTLARIEVEINNDIPFGLYTIVQNEDEQGASEERGE